MSIDVNRLGPDAKRQIAAKSAVAFVKKQNKLHAVKESRTMENGTTYTFHSRKEARRFDELMFLLESGKIRNLKVQPHYTLREAYILPNGEKVKREEYIADFEYEEMVSFRYSGQSEMWETIVEDVKGMRTPMYLRKKNEMLDKYGIRIREV